MGKTEEKPFRVLSEENPLRLKFRSNLSDRDWKNYFGEIQKILKCGKKLDGKVIFDFSASHFIDPTPLLSICLSMAYFLIEGGSIDIKFASIDDASINKKSFLKFLAREGFLNLFLNDINNISKNCSSLGKIVCYSGSKIITTKNIKEIATIKNRLNYERSYCLPAQLLKFEIIDDALFNGEIHRKILDRIDHLTDSFIKSKVCKVVESEVTKSAQESLLYKLRIACREALHNTVEHAYANSSKPIGLAAIYIRFRVGRIGANQDELKFIDRGICRESLADESPVPKLDNVFVNQKPGFFEVFVCDVGRGITKSDPHLEVMSNLNSVMYEIFHRGYSRKSNRPTKFGGLHLLADLARISNDYFRLCDNSTWWGTTLPLVAPGYETKAVERTPLGQSKSEGRHSLEGCYLTLRYAWADKDGMRSFLDWSTIRADFGDSSLGVYIDSKPHLRLNLPCLEDNRTTNSRFENFNDLSVGDEFSFYLPQVGSMKNRIQKNVNEFIKKANRKTLFIGDIQTIEALAYVSAIEGTEFLGINSRLDTIYLITSGLHYLKLTKNVGGFLRVAVDASQCRGEIFEYLKVMRAIDSERLWSNLFDRHGGMPRVQISKIEWFKNYFIDGYIDPSFIFSDLDNKVLLKYSLDRYRSLLDTENQKVIPMDSLVKNFTDNYNREEVLRGYGEGSIHFGSVHVTGETTRRTLPSPQDKEVYCYCHPSGPLVCSSLFSWIEELNVESSPIDNYKRVGNTPFIARNGWKFYTLPRYARSGKSVYAQKPSELYDSIQDYTRPIAKLGHWQYSSHHDFLTMNLLTSFDSEVEDIGFFANSDLASFVLANLFKVFKVYKKDLNSKGKKVFDRITSISKKINDYTINIDQSSHVPILVYPSHAVTEHVVDFFLGLIKSGVKADGIQGRIVPFVHTRKNRRVSSFQISGPTYEYLNGCINRIAELDKKKTSIVFFDDALISSRTLQEVESIVKGLGVDNVYSLVLLDRQRLPFSNNVEKGTNFSYSRLDVPTIGSRDNCPICMSLKIAEELSSMFLCGNTQKRLDSWNVDWMARSTTSEWGGNGLKSLPVELMEPLKKYGIDKFTGEQAGVDVDDKNNNKICIKSSIGLISWITEMQTITGRDDLAILIVDGENISNEASIQILASQILIFREEHEDLTLRDLSSRLLTCSSNIENENIHTSLASIVMLNLKKKVLFGALEVWLGGQSGLDFFDFNLDVQILLSYAAKKGFVFGSSIYGASLARLAFRPIESSDFLWRFHYNVTDVRGKSHVSPLNRVSNISSRYLTSRVEFGLAISFLMEVFECGIFEHLSIDGDNYRKLSIHAKKHIENINDITKKVGHSSLKSEGIHHLLDSLKREVRPLLSSLTHIHALLFKSIGDGSINISNNVNLLSYLENEVSKKGNGVFADTILTLIEHFSLDMDIKFNNVDDGNRSILSEWMVKNDFNEVYVLFNSNIIFILNELFSNLKHCEKTKIMNPYPGARSPVTAHAWINGYAKLDEGFYCIEITNYKNDDDLSSDDIDIKKLKRSIGKITKNGGNYKINTKKIDRFSVVLYLPLAHTLEGLD